NLWPWLILLYSCAADGAVCDRQPPGMAEPKTRADNRFTIEISGDPDVYTPGEMYTGE
ncbi:unnamed protein product, partial [Nesidiocoris tenuis]